MNDVAVIIPVYNESKVIAKVIKEVLRTFKYVVCVDDGSRDTSSEEILKTKAFLVQHPVNMGQGAALQTGIEFAKGLPVKYFVTFDADGQHLVKDAVAMIKVLKQKNLDIILGSRFLGKTIGMKKSKEALLKAAIVFSNFTSGLKLTDTHNGLRAFNRHVADTMQITLPDMSHASEILEIIKRNDYTYMEIPVTIRYTDYSTSKGQGLINAVNIGFDALLRKLIK